MEKTSRPRNWIGVTTVVAGAITIAAAALSARRAGISLRAALLLATVPLMAPKFDGEGELERAIQSDRARGAETPSKPLLKRFDFREETRGKDRLMRLSVKTNVGPLRLLYLHGGAYVFDLQSVQWAVPAGLLGRVGGAVVAPAQAPG